MADRKSETEVAKSFTKKWSANLVDDAYRKKIDPIFLQIELLKFVYAGFKHFDLDIQLWIDIFERQETA
jgi:hypothetical protein